MHTNYKLVLQFTNKQKGVCCLHWSEYRKA